MGQYIKPINTDYLKLSGGTVSGDTYFSQNLSASTIVSGSTDLYNIFQTIGSDLNKTCVQDGLNTYTGGTEDLPTVNVSAATLSTLSVSGTSEVGVISATTIISGSTNLYDIFDVKGSEDITRVQPGSNITTGGTANNPIVNLVDSPSVNNFVVSGTSEVGVISATTIISGSTNLYNIFALDFDEIDGGAF